MSGECEISLDFEKNISYTINTSPTEIYRLSEQKTRGINTMKKLLSVLLCILFLYCIKYPLGHPFTILHSSLPFCISSFLFLWSGLLSSVHLELIICHKESLCNVINASVSFFPKGCLVHM